MIKYWQQQEGIIKKQIKYTCYSRDEYDILMRKKTTDRSMAIVTLKHVEKELTNHHKSEDDQQTLFKNVSKITIGMSNKEILNFRTKQKGAFYNCFMLVLRIQDENNIFKEVNIKTFNTGKMSFPGMISQFVLNKAIKYITTLLSQILNQNIYSLEHTIDTVLINSNFSCGYFLDRNKLYNILKYTYKLHTTYDPCSYPGIQCKYYYNSNNNGICTCSPKCGFKEKSNIKRIEHRCTEVSFMIFRTGSILIVGHCSETVLICVYKFLKNILLTEFSEINIAANDISGKKEKKKKLKKKTILVKLDV